MKRYITPQEAIDAGWRWRLFLAKAWQPMLFGLLITLAFLACGAPALAQTRKAYDLSADFQLGPMQSQTTLANLGSEAAARAKYPRVFARFEGQGWTAGKVMTLSAFDAAWWEAILQGQGGGQPITGMVASNNHIVVPAGTYYQTIDAVFSSGEYIGAGSGYSDANNASVNTRLVLWHERWNGDPADRNCLKSAAVGFEGNMSYVESTVIRGFALEGRQNEALGQSFRSCGIRMSKPGEVTHTTDIYARNFRTYGIDVSGATPHHIGTVSVFDNVVAGIGCEGCWGSTVRIDMVSGDDNGAMISSTNTPTQTGGGTWSIGAVKLETCVASQARAWRGQAVGIFEGQFAVDVSAISYAGGSCRMDALFVVDARQPNGNPQSSFVSVGASKGWNFSHAVHDIGNRKRWGLPGQYHGSGFSWAATQSGIFTSLPAMTATTGACSVRVNFDRTAAPSHSTCTAYRAIADGPPRAAAITYLDQITGTTPPRPPPPACTFTYSAWTACTNGTQTRTATSAPTGCMGTPPPDSVSRACTVAPPPSPPGTAGTFNPADVLVVANSADPRSAAWATAYAQAWGIPAANVIAVNAGTSHVATSATLTAIRNAVNARGLQITLLAWEYPSRLGNGQSITSAVDFGERNPGLFTVSPHFGYTGLRPRADRGFAKSFLLVSDRYIRRDAHATRPSGQAILYLAKDSPSAGNPRGSARAGQAVSGLIVHDLRSTAIGGGNNVCNWISNACFLAPYRPGATPIVAAYQSNYVLGDDGADVSRAVWAKGFYGDHLTSFGGWLPGGAAPSYINNAPQNQTALVYHLERGASLSVGAVSEPNTNLTRQFVRVDLFHPRFVSGLPVGAAAYSSVECPDRMLFAGDPLCAPFAR